MTETTAFDRRRDPFDDALEDLRVAGSLLLAERYRSPWAVDVPGEARLRTLLGAGRDTRVLVFHLVRQGSFDLHAPQRRTAQGVSAGELVICCAGQAHRLSEGRGASAVSIEALIGGHAARRTVAAGDDTTQLVCGAFFMRATALNPLLTALPPLIRAGWGIGGDDGPLAALVDLLGREIDRPSGGRFAIARLLELICAQVLRAHQRDAPAGWFRALSDPRVSEVLRGIHAEPGRAWSIESLAAIANLSPSRFAARFRAATGSSAMAYVADWRANLASRLLRETSLGLAEVGARVGYESAAAFSRAFKSRLGCAPGGWRRDGDAALSAPRPARLGRA